MAVKVYGWRKATLELAVVEGGSLTANTTYYVCGMMKHVPQTYNSVCGPLSDIYSISTTSTARTISITQKTYRDIEYFSETVSGLTTVASTRHCLNDNDVIYIESGLYSGNWTITKLDYNTFTINTPFIGTEQVQCYTSGLYYNHPEDASGSYYNNSNYTCMTYYISTSNPLEDGIEWNGGNLWTAAPYQNFNNTNPALITAQPTQRGNGHGELTVREINRGPYSTVKDYGTVGIYLTGSHSLEEIYNEVFNSGFIHNMYYHAGTNTMNLVGTIATVNNLGYLTISGANITLVCGELMSKGQATQLNVNGCVINIVPKATQAQLYFNGSGNILTNNAGSVALTGLIYGENNIYHGPAYMGGQYSESYTNLGNGSTINAEVHENEIYRSNDQTLNTQVSYGGTIFRNCTVIPVYYTLIRTPVDYIPNIYMMENCYLIQSGSNLWHFRFFQYPEQAGYQNIIKYLNIDTDDTNNVKKIVNNIAGNYDIRFHRRMEFYIQDIYGSPIYDANIKVQLNDGTEYTVNTTVSGYGYIDYLEQRTVITDTDGTRSTHDPQFDTFYNVASVEVSANSYITYAEFINNNISLDNVISLTATPETPTEFLPLPEGYGQLTGPLAPEGGDNPLGGEMFIGGGLDSDQANLLKDSIYNNYINEKTIRVPKNTINGQEVTSEIVEITIASALSQGLITQESLTDLRQLSDTMADTIIEHIKTYAETEGSTNEIIDLKDHVSIVNNNILQLYSTLSSWVPVTMDGGGALKIALSSVLPDMVSELTQNEANMQSTFIYETMEKNIK